MNLVFILYLLNYFDLCALYVFKLLFDLPIENSKDPEKNAMSLKNSNKTGVLVPLERIEDKIFLIRGQKVMIDKDLAGLYGVPNKRLKEQVRRNVKRFPSVVSLTLLDIWPLHNRDSESPLSTGESKVNGLPTHYTRDFMFELTWAEAESIGLRSQNATLKRGKHLKYLPFAFTEQGVAMLSSVLKSERAIAVNIQIMRTFTRLRKLMMTHHHLARKIEALQRKFKDHDQKITAIFQAIRRLLEEPQPKKKGPMGFLPPES